MHRTPRVTTTGSTTTLLTLVALLALVLPAAVTATAPAAHAQDDTLVLEVTTTDDLALADGATCPAEGGDECSLRAAVEVADDADEDDEVLIDLAADTVYGLDHADGPLTLEDALPVRLAGNSRDPAVIDGAGLQDTILDTTGTDLSLEGVEVINGAGTGAIVGDEAELSVTDSVLEHNTGTRSAAISWDEGPVTIERSELRDNDSASSGGAIRVNDDELTIVDSVLADNTAGGQGGAVMGFGGASVTITDSTLVGNVAGDRGGAVSATNVTVQGDSLLADNRADGIGGAIASTSVNATHVIDGTDGDVVLRDNEAGEGGGAVNATAGSLTVTAATLRDNRAGGIGGGAIATVEGTITVEEGSLLEGNITTGGGAPNGGAIVVDAEEEQFGRTPQVAVRDSDLRDHRASGSGGAISVRDGELEVEGAVLEGNRSTINRGGAIAVDLDAEGAVVDSTIAGNEARTGGGLSSRGGDLQVTGSVVRDNRSGDDRHGGGIAVALSAGSVEVANSTISGNLGGSYGGGLAANGGSIALDAVTVAGNGLQADGEDLQGGAGLGADNAGGIDLTGSIVADNDGDGCWTGSNASITSEGHNLGTDGTCGLDEGLGDVVEGEAALGLLGDHGGPTATHLLGVDSDARDASATTLSVDQRGVARPQGADPDIGAVEMEPVDPGAIEGDVVDDDGEAVADATVDVAGPSLTGAVTDAGGGWTVGDLLPGTYTVTVEAEGFVTDVEEDVEVTEGATTTLSTTLSRPDPEPACPEGQVPSAGFTDVSAGSVHAAAVDCLAWHGITEGRTADTYGPAGTVTRAQQASFVARLMEAAGVQLPVVDGDAFGDIAGSPHAEAISQLAELDVVRGRTADAFAPGRSVTRGQSASMVVRAVNEILDEPLPAPAGPFTDTAGNVHEASIDAAAEAGIALGRTADAFEPSGVTRRDQMASLLGRALEVLAAQRHVETPQD